MSHLDSSYPTKPKQLDWYINPDTNTVQLLVLSCPQLQKRGKFQIESSDSDFEDMQLSRFTLEQFDESIISMLSTMPFKRKLHASKYQKQMWLKTASHETKTFFIFIFKIDL